MATNFNIYKKILQQYLSTVSEVVGLHPAFNVNFLHACGKPKVKLHILVCFKLYLQNGWSVNLKATDNWSLVYAPLNIKWGPFYEQCIGKTTQKKKTEKFTYPQYYSFEAIILRY